MEKEELDKLIKIIIEKNKEFNREQLNFTDYCFEKMEDRGVNQDLVVSLILEGEPYYIEKQKIELKESEETRYKKGAFFRVLFFRVCFGYKSLCLSECLFWPLGIFLFFVAFFKPASCD